MPKVDLAHCRKIIDQTPMSHQQHGMLVAALEELRAAREVIEDAEKLVKSIENRSLRPGAYEAISKTLAAYRKVVGE